MNVGIVGYGTIGRAMGEYLRNHTKHGVVIRDPRLGRNDVFGDCDAIFISIPVPTLEDGTQDLTSLQKVIGECRGKPIFVRSTVLPGTCDSFEVTAMPEFLTARTALSDFEKQPILTGGHSSLLNALFPKKKIVQVSNIEAEITKYGHNCFGALKVTYANYLYMMCQQLQCSYEHVKMGLTQSGYISPNHLDVPGPDGKKGFGGHCFPKDLKALNNFFGGTLLSATETLNEKYRSLD